MAPFVVALLLATVLAPPASGEPEVDPTRPLAAIAIGSGDTAIVAWAPALDTPDFYNIYGVRNDSFSFLTFADAETTFAQVDGGFPEYAVTAVNDGVETEPALAVLGVGLICVRVEPGIPPGFGVDYSCTARAGVKVALMKANV